MTRYADLDIPPEGRVASASSRRSGADTRRLISSTTEIVFTPALPEHRRIEPGIGYLQPGGLVVHTGWGIRSRGDKVLRQLSVYEGGGVQSWKISTPCGHQAARFQYLTRPDAEAAAARMTAVLPEGVWPADADTLVLLPLALEASEGPTMLPFVHRGKPNWGSGYGGDITEFWVPESQEAYERMITAHGRIPKTCQVCTRLLRKQNLAGRTTPRTNHWPLWSASRAQYVRAHCACEDCLKGFHA